MLGPPSPVAPSPSIPLSRPTESEVLPNPSLAPGHDHPSRQMGLAELSPRTHPAVDPECRCLRRLGRAETDLQWPLPETHSAWALRREHVPLLSSWMPGSHEDGTGAASRFQAHPWPFWEAESSSAPRELAGQVQLGPESPWPPGPQTRPLGLPFFPKK